jgi:Holliday junction resolvase RusA-like endonuclease
MPTSTRIEVRGQPAPQGSKSFKGMVNGHAIMAESSKAVKPWREDVKWACLRMGFGRESQTIHGPLAVSMVFTMPKPKSAPKRKRTWPDRTPDLSKLVRSTEDALTQIGVWEDDARVVEYIRVAKVFPGEDRDALDTPGCVIEISSIEAA